MIAKLLRQMPCCCAGLSMHVVRAASAALVSTLKALPRDGEVNLPVVRCPSTLRSSSGGAGNEGGRLRGAGWRYLLCGRSVDEEDPGSA